MTGATGVTSETAPAPESSSPLDAIGSIKVKLGVLVAASVVVAALIGAAGARSGVPLLLWLPVAVALALGVTQLLAAGMVAPFREMTAVAQAMARGDYSGRIDTQATDEVGRLAAAFNSMADDLAAVDRERRDLVATVSHEIRTPLAGLTALLENLADGVVPTDGPHLAAELGGQRVQHLAVGVAGAAPLRAQAGQEQGRARLGAANRPELYRKRKRACKRDVALEILDELRGER